MPEGRYGLNAGEVSVVTGDGRLKLGWWAREVVRLGVVVDVDSRSVMLVLCYHNGIYIHTAPLSLAAVWRCVMRRKCMGRVVVVIEYDKCPPRRRLVQSSFEMMRATIFLLARRTRCSLLHT